METALWGTGWFALVPAFIAQVAALSCFLAIDDADTALGRERLGHQSRIYLWIGLGFILVAIGFMLAGVWVGALT